MTTKAAGGVRETWRDTSGAVRALLAGAFANRLGGFLQVFAVFYMIDAGYSRTQSAGVLGAYGIGSIGGTLLGGWLSDTLDGRRTIVISMACSAVLLLCVYYISPYPAKFLVTLLAGVAGQAYRPASATILSRLTPPERRLMVFAMNRLAVNLGATALPLLGAALVAVSYGFLFWGEAVAAMSFAIIVMIAVPRAHDGRSHVYQRPGENDHINANATRNDTQHGIFTDRRYVVFLAGLLIQSLVYVQYLSILPLDTRQRHLGVAAYASLVTINGIVVISLELLVTRFTQDRHPRGVIVASMALTGLGMTLYAPQWGLWGLIMATLIWSLGEVVGAPTLYFAYPAATAPPTRQGQYLGAASAMFGLGGALGPVLSVTVWNHLDTYTWWLSAPAALLAITAAHLGVRDHVPVQS